MQVGKYINAQAAPDEKVVRLSSQHGLLAEDAAVREHPPLVRSTHDARPACASMDTARFTTK